MCVAGTFEGAAWAAPELHLARYRPAAGTHARARSLRQLSSKCPRLAWTVAVRWRRTRNADLPLPRTVWTRPRSSTFCPLSSGFRFSTSIQCRPETDWDCDGRRGTDRHDRPEVLAKSLGIGSNLDQGQVPIVVLERVVLIGLSRGLLLLAALGGTLGLLPLAFGLPSKGSNRHECVRICTCRSDISTWAARALALASSDAERLRSLTALETREISADSDCGKVQGSGERACDEPVRCDDPSSYAQRLASGGARAYLGHVAVQSKRSWGCDARGRRGFPGGRCWCKGLGIKCLAVVRCLVQEPEKAALHKRSSSAWSKSCRSAYIAFIDPEIDPIMNHVLQGYPQNDTLGCAETATQAPLAETRSPRR